MRSASPSAIVADALYPIREIDAVTGSESATRSMRRQGLTVRRLGKRSFVLGRDFISFVEQQGRIVSPAGTITA